MFQSAHYLAVAALGLSASAVAIPVRRGKTRLTRETSLAIGTVADIVTDVSADVLANLNLFEQYSATAYCASDFDATSGATISCESGNCPLVQNAGATALYGFDE
jgi:hypothetical protein